MDLAYDLFLLMFNLSQFRNKERIIKLFIESMQEAFKPVDFVFQKESKDVSADFFELKSGIDSYGFINIKKSENITNEAQALIRSAVQMLANILSKVSLENVLKDERDSLNIVAAKRLKKLEKTVKELNKSRVASINLIEDLSDEINSRELAEKARHESEEQLKTSELKYRSIIESVHDAIISVDSSGTIVAWNKAAVAMFGYEKFETIGKNITLIIPEGFREKHIAGFSAATKNHKLSEFAEGVLELEGKRKNSTVFPMEMTLCHWQIEDEIFFSANIRDATLRKEYEFEILKLSQVVEQSRVSVVITDLDANIEYVNQFFTELTGYSKEEILGQNPRILSSGEISKNIYTKMYSKISQGRIWYGEFHNKKKNGKLYWEETIITPIKDINGNIINYCAIKVDITNRKRIESEVRKYRERLEMLVQERTIGLQKSEETFRALAENSRDTVMRFDINYKHLYVNPVITEQTGIGEKDFIGKTHAELGFPEDLVKQWEEAIKKVFDNKKTNRIEFMLPNGIWIDWVLVPEFDINKNVIAAVGSGRDITKLKNLEIELNTTLKKEHELNELKTQFISTVSHEFRTPLTSIFSSIDLLDLFGEKWSISKKKEHFEQMRGSILRLTGMLDEVLQVSRMESGKIAVNYEKVDLETLIKSILKEAEPLLTPKHKFVNSINLEQKSYNLDKEIIRTILLNLLSNAIKYSHEGGNIEIVTKREEIHLLLSVKDNGQGIKEKDLKDIFSKFYRTESAMHVQGSGLGLSIVKTLVAKINGEITVSSKFGEGTLFTVKIPIEANEN